MRWWWLRAAPARNEVLPLEPRTDPEAPVRVDWVSYRVSWWRQVAEVRYVPLLAAAVVVELGALLWEAVRRGY